MCHTHVSVTSGLFFAALYREDVMTKAAQTCDAGRSATEHSVLQLQTAQL